MYSNDDDNEIMSEGIETKKRAQRVFRDVDEDDSDSFLGISEQSSKQKPKSKKEVKRQKGVSRRN